MIGDDDDEVMDQPTNQTNKQPSQQTPHQESDWWDFFRPREFLQFIPGLAFRQCSHLDMPKAILWHFKILFRFLCPLQLSVGDVLGDQLVHRDIHEGGVIQGQ